MKKLITILLATAAATAFGNAAQADPTFKSEPRFLDLGVSLFSRQPIEGLPATRGIVTLIAEANVAAECTNPGGGSRAVTAEPIEVAGFQRIFRKAINNGEFRMRIVTIPPDADIDGAPDCPSDKWTETITDLLFTSAILTVQQPIGHTVLTTSCAFTPPTANGRIPAANVICN
jgi:hypothetical protein